MAGNVQPSDGGTESNFRTRLEKHIEWPAKDIKSIETVR